VPDDVSELDGELLQLIHAPAPKSAAISAICA
jgi:hypothetical protein